MAVLRLKVGLSHTKGRGSQPKRWQTPPEEHSQVTDLAEVPDIQQFEVVFEVTHPMPARYHVVKPSQEYAYRKYILRGSVFFLSWKTPAVLIFFGSLWPLTTQMPPPPPP
jgi:hypothetical protein